jgi:hypothetical protein
MASTGISMLININGMVRFMKNEQYGNKFPEKVHRYCHFCNTPVSFQQIKPSGFKKNRMVAGQHLPDSTS